MVWLNLAIRFVVELLGVGFVGYWGLNASDDTRIGVLLAIGAMVIVGVVWGLFLAPTATRGLSKVQKDVVGTGVLLVAAGALALAGQPMIALAYAIVVLVNAVVLWRLGGEVERSLGTMGRRG
jgi:hypothetical protein